MQRIINRNAQIISTKEVVMIRGEDGTILCLSIKLALTLAENLRQMAAISASLTEPSEPQNEHPLPHIPLPPVPNLIQ